MALLPDPGLLMPQPANFAAGGDVYNRVLVTIPVPAIDMVTALRTVTGARYVSNTDTVVDNSGIGLPGFALRKGLRVLTLQEDKRVAFPNIIES